MANSITITLPHRLGAAEAKKRITEGMEALRRDYIGRLAHTEANWNGDTADVRVVALGQTVTGTIAVLSDSVRIEVQLPWIIAALSGRIQGILKNSAEQSLRLGPPQV